MSGAKDNGGPAFPIMTTVFATDPDGNPVQSNVVHHGMTLRDYFAGQVIAAAVQFWLGKSATDAMVAAWAYETADAMIAARKGGDR